MFLTFAVVCFIIQAILTALAFTKMYKGEDYMKEFVALTIFFVLFFVTIFLK